MPYSLKDRYVRHVDAVIHGNPYDEAMGLAVGGAPAAIGALELALLRHCGLQEDSYLIDIGCGSGRLTLPLSRTHKGRYLGTDLVPKLLDYNRAKVSNRADWRFEEVNGLTIPEEDAQADMVCFFSVFTHLLHEQTFLYLEEARRVLRPGGLVVFSFLEFGVQWDIFLANVERERAGAAEGAVLNVFIDPPAITLWAAALGFEVIDLRAGSDRFIPTPEPAAGDAGLATTVMSAFGQSVCVLRKPLDPASSRDSLQNAPRQAEELAQLQEKIDALELQVSALRSSTSWRLTRPLRALRAWMGAPPAA